MKLCRRSVFQRIMWSRYCKVMALANGGLSKRVKYEKKVTDETKSWYLMYRVDGATACGGWGV